jgi:hypothetical protein
MNWLTITPKPTALSSANGAFAEYFLSYNRKLFLREKYNVAASLGVAYLGSHGLSVQKKYNGTPFSYTTPPDEARIYTTFGVSSAYHFSRNNYLTIQFIRNIFGIATDISYFDRLQLQYEHRF